MTMGTPNRTISAARFKAQCLALLDKVARTGQPIVVTKRGRPVARLAPLQGQGPKDLRGSIVFEEDLVAPVAAPWQAAR